MGNFCTKNTEKKVAPAAETTEAKAPETTEAKAPEATEIKEIKAKIVFVLGGPGSGKGTVCAR